QPKGLSTVDAVREQVKALVTREKKAELLAKKITDAGAANVDALAAKVGKPALQADKVTFGNPSLGGSYEPKVVATALGLGAGKLSAPVQGNAGVYAVQTIAVAEPAKVSDYAMYSMQLKQQINAKARGINDAHKKLAKIEDHRFDFY
ncbi:MAG: peptidylprolyl isomerase, partial [Bacteroidetes bacterium]|nr:peptidylprolyl isomerase [Bacteroidota bacterium]